MNEYLSKKISFLSLISMLAVVFIHAYNYTDTFLQPHTIITEGLHPVACVQYAISNALTRFAVPMFFMISGFLFFFGKDFSTSVYVKQVKKRCRTVLSVFVIFSVISFAVCHLVYSFTGEGVIGMIDERIIKNPLYALLQNPYAFQLWFLAQLFIMSIVSPVIYFLIKKIKFVLPVILACLWFMDKQLVVGGYTLFNSDAYMFFTLGAYIAVEELNFKTLYQKTENTKLWIGSLVLWIFVAAVYTLFSATADKSSCIQLILFKLCVLLGMVTVWLSYDRFSAGVLEHPVTKTLSENNFMVYLLHEPLLHIIFMSTITYCKADIVHILLYFVLPVVIIMLCAYIGKILRNKCPGLNSILTGGR